MSSSIPALKRTFLASQVRILNAPLEPPADWREGRGLVLEGALEEEVVEEVMRKVNRKIKSHNAAAFPAQALSHVAQQIDALYWAAAEPDAEGAEVHPDAVRVGADLRDEDIISSLPETYPTDSPPSSPRPSKRSRPSALETFDTSSRYALLRTKLQDLNTRRMETQQELDQARALAELLRPLADAPVNVQPNLVVKGGELEREVGRMKVLAARLVDGLRAKAREGSVTGGEEISEVSEEEKGVKKKLEEVMDLDLEAEMGEGRV
ncbi:hypothetical protein MMC10_004242 [Thelotrema lepadinum]|nr:hypothetical protein [Thelotrema lepadinum]